MHIKSTSIHIILTIIIAFSTAWQASLNNKQKNISLFNLKLEHYRKFAKIIETFIELDKCQIEKYHKTCDNIKLQLRYCAQEANFLFNKEIANLENEIYEEFKKFIEECGDIEKIKDEIFNNIVRTKYKKCRENMEKDLKETL